MWTFALALEVLEHLPDAMTLSEAVRDEKGAAVDFRPLWMNAAARADQPAPDETVGQLASNLWPQLIQNGAFDACLRVLDTGRPEAGEFLWTESQFYRPSRYEYKAVRIGSDQLLWVLRDTRERVKKTLADSARLRALFEAAPVGLAEISRTGTVLMTNLAFEHFVGQSLVGKPLVYACHPVDASTLSKAIRRTPPQTSAPVEVRFVTPSGQTLWAAVTLAPLQFDEAEEPRIVAHIVDITDTVNRRHAQRLEIVGQLAGSLAHDFNNVLQVVGAAVEDVASHLEKGGDDQRLLQDALSAVDQAAGLVRRLLVFSHREIVSPQDVDVAATLRAAQPLIESLVGDRVTVETEFHTNGASVRLDPNQLVQIVLNLVSNARDAVHQGGRIRVTAERLVLTREDIAEWTELTPGLHVFLRVDDNGEGMSPETIERAFDPFFTTKSQERGTGLGLYTVFRIVQQARGALRIASSAGEGTSVRVVLPAKASHEAAGISDTNAPDELSGSVLVVDDQPAVCDLVARFLESAGLEVTRTTSAQGAKDAARERHYDLLIADVLMPGETGPELARELLDQGRISTVMFMTAYGGPAPLAELTPAGITPRVVAKPFRRAELLGVVKDVLREVRRGRAA